MVLCDKDCIPCCDFCKHVFYKWGEIGGKTVALAPIGCKLHEDAAHQSAAKACGYCEDFHCAHADEED